jgi:SAM-dependent methyltransferase
MLNGLRDRILSNAYQHSKKCSRINLYRMLSESISDYRLAAPAVTLNIGSGGEIESTINGAGARPTSVDIDSSRKPDIVASIERLHMIQDASFDAVFCMEVLEHVRDPFAASSEIKRVLRPGGVVIGSTPFILGIHDAPNDFYRFTEHGIRHLFRELVEVEVTPRNNVFDAAKVIPMRLFAVGSPQEKYKLAFRWPLLRLANWLYSIAGRGITNSDATTGYFFVFRKDFTDR